MEKARAGLNSSMRPGIEGVSYALGSSRLSNTDLGLQNPQWDMEQIIVRTGVFSRPIAKTSETSLDLGERAADALLKSIAVSIDQIDALIFCTQTPDYVLPPNSSLLHGRMGMSQEVMAFDITHACSGFIYGLGIARSLIQSGTATRVLLINADTYTHLLHPQDRATRPIFGDGAAATLISAAKPMLSILDMTFSTAGKQSDRFIVKSGGARQPICQSEINVVIDQSGRIRSDEHIYMDGMGVLSFFTGVIPRAVKQILSRNKLSVDDIGLFIFHQASQLALEGLQRSLAIPEERMFIDLHNTGNLVSASIPVALARVIASQRLQPGQLIVLCGFGVGLSWGTALVRYKG